MEDKAAPIGHRHSTCNALGSAGDTPTHPTDRGAQHDPGGAACPSDQVVCGGK